MGIGNRIIQEKHEALAVLSSSALSGGALDDLLNEAVQLVAHILQTPYCKIIERIPCLPSDKCLLLRAVIGWSPELESQVFNQGDKPHAAYTLELLKPVVVDDINQETRFQPAPLHRAYNIISGASVVIFGNESAPL
jgi:GAF domain-containing protein